MNLHRSLVKFSIIATIVCGVGGFAAWLSSREPTVLPGLNDTESRLRDYDNRTLLWAYGTHYFDISDFVLDTRQLRQGGGINAIPSVAEPRFTPVPTANWMNDNDEVVVVAGVTEAQIYPIRQLSIHEAVNAYIDGVPILVAYCHLADLSAVYDRRVGARTLTFGASGYTYLDRQRWSHGPAFVLWDVETESLWWPPVGQAVAGREILSNPVDGVLIRRRVF